MKQKAECKITKCMLRLCMLSNFEFIILDFRHRMAYGSDPCSRYMENMDERQTWICSIFFILLLHSWKWLIICVNWCQSYIVFIRYIGCKCIRLFLDWFPWGKLPHSSLLVMMTTIQILAFCFLENVLKDLKMSFLLWLFKFQIHIIYKHNNKMAILCN